MLEKRSKLLFMNFTLRTQKNNETCTIKRAIINNNTQTSITKNNYINSASHKKSNGNNRTEYNTNNYKTKIKHQTKYITYVNNINKTKTKTNNNINNINHKTKYITNNRTKANNNHSTSYNMLQRKYSQENLLRKPSFTEEKSIAIEVYKGKSSCTDLNTYNETKLSTTKNNSLSQLLLAKAFIKQQMISNCNYLNGINHKNEDENDYDEVDGAYKIDSDKEEENIYDDVNNMFILEKMGLRSPSTASIISIDDTRRHGIVAISYK
eukprot:Pgem_evm1s3146